DHVRIGDSIVPLRIDQGLLQLRLLDKDGLAVPGVALYLHAAPPRDRNRSRREPAAARPLPGGDVAGPVVWGGVGRALDWFFLTVKTRLCGSGKFHFLRQTYREDCSPARSLVHLDRSAMYLNCALDNRQAEAR